MKPFDPKTAKNGDVCYRCYSKEKFIFIGPTPISGHERFVIVYDVANKYYKQMPYENLRLKTTKRTVWINVYGNDLACYWYDTETIAKDCADTDSGFYIGTYPLEIEE
jgi:hypothetical protein